MNDDDIRRLRWVLGDIMTYAESVQKALDKKEGVNRQAERIRALRNVTGRTPEEAEAFLQKAEQLEGK